MVLSIVVLLKQVHNLVNIINVSFLFFFISPVRHEIPKFCREWDRETVTGEVKLKQKLNNMKEKKEYERKHEK